MVERGGSKQGATAPTPLPTTTPAPAPPRTLGSQKPALLQLEIETALKTALTWTATHRNQEPLWSEVRIAVSQVLNGFFRAGQLQGSSPAQAYFVTCDRTTMTQTDIDNGRLNVVVGIAPVKPAEFIILRIGLWTKTE